MNPDVKDFYDFKPEDFKLLDYEHGPQIKGIPVAV
jgi:thymidylate synthase